MKNYVPNMFIAPRVLLKYIFSLRGTDRIWHGSVINTVKYHVTIKCHVTGKTISVTTSQNRMLKKKLAACIWTSKY